MIPVLETRRGGVSGATLGSMPVMQAVASRRHQSRPGRGVLVAVSLDSLQGPVTGTVELPLWLFWNPDRTFDLDEPGMLEWVYRVVLREAASPADLEYLNGARLAELWPELFLPDGVRAAWEEQHPALADAAAAARAA